MKQYFLREKRHRHYGWQLRLDQKYFFGNVFPLTSFPALCTTCSE